MAAAAITLRELHLATATESDCRQWLRGQGLLAANMQCPKCNTAMQEQDYSRVLDGRIWRCPPKQCRATVSLRKGSFFERSHLPLTKLTDLIYYWSINVSNTEAEYELGVDGKTITDWYNFLREVGSADMIANPVQLGGPGTTVAIDESVVAKAKPGNAHARPVPQQWVFGGVQLGTDRFFMELVPQRDAATLVPIIQRYILPGTRIWSDEWRAYAGLNAIGYVHQTVNHSLHYVDPVTGVQTNNIEARWSACKSAFKRRHGIARHLLPGYIDEYMWRCYHGRPRVFGAVVDAIRRQYPV